jgi:hypothetical protein
MSISLTSSLNTRIDDYYSQVDLVNKYRIKSAHKSPRIKKMTFELPLNQFFYASSEIKDNVNLQVKSFLILFIIFSLVPFILFNDIKTHIKSSKDKDSNKNFALKVVVTKKQDFIYLLRRKFLSINLFANTEYNNVLEINNSKINSNKFNLVAKNFIDIQDYNDFKGSKPIFEDLKVSLVVNFSSGEINNFNKIYLLRNIMNA